MTGALHHLTIAEASTLIVWDNFADVLNPDVTRYLADISSQRQLFHLRNTKLVVCWNKES